MLAVYYPWRRCIVICFIPTGSYGFL